MPTMPERPPERCPHPWNASRGNASRAVCCCLRHKGMERWYALRSRSAGESGVARNLAKKGYEAFLPTYKKKRHWSDRTKIVELALFPGYLFCRFDVATRLPI